MTRYFTLLLLISFSLSYTSCKKNSHNCKADGNWIRRADFDGASRSDAVSFVIGDTAYVATGYNLDRLNDVWRYNPDGNNWSQRASLPGDKRNGAVGFSISNKGYICTGYNGANRLKDNWEYDPTKNQWTRKADFGGTARISAVGFSIGDKGYVATGNDGTDLSDCWMYDPIADNWIQKANINGSARQGAVAFVYNGQAWLVTGTLNGNAVNDFLVYTPSKDDWSAKRPITDVSADAYDDNYYNIIRSKAVAFVKGDYAYLCTGEKTGDVFASVWEYNFSKDIWTRKTDWEGTARTSAIGFTVKGKSFLGLGRSSAYEFSDFREFFPFDCYNPND